MLKSFSLVTTATSSTHQSVCISAAAVVCLDIFGAFLTRHEGHHLEVDSIVEFFGLIGQLSLEFGARNFNSKARVHRVDFNNVAA